MRLSARFLPVLLAAVGCSGAEPPADSPRRIVYVEDKPLPGGGTDRQLAVVRQDGSGYLQLATSLSGNGAPATAPDGQSVIYLSYEMAWRSVSTNGGATVNLQLPASVANPLWSPSSRRIAWINYGNIQRLALSEAGGSTVTNITPDSVYVDPGTSWSPDNSRLAVWRRVNKEIGPDWDLYTITVTGLLRPLVVGPEHKGPAAWSPDGRTIAYTLPYATEPGNGIYLVDPDGSNARQLVSGYFDGELYWSPGGETIAFSGYRGGPAPGISLIDVATGQAGAPLSLPSYPSLMTRPWSRDGSLLLLTATGPSGYAVYTVDRSGTLTQLTPDSVSARSPSWVE